MNKSISELQLGLPPIDPSLTKSTKNAFKNRKTNSTLLKDSYPGGFTNTTTRSSIGETCSIENASSSCIEDFGSISMDGGERMAKPLRVSIGLAGGESFMSWAKGQSLYENSSMDLSDEPGNDAYAEVAGAFLRRGPSLQPILTFAQVSDKFGSLSAKELKLSNRKELRAKRRVIICILSIVYAN